MGISIGLARSFASPPSFATGPAAGSRGRDIARSASRLGRVGRWPRLGVLAVLAVSGSTAMVLLSRVLPRPGHPAGEPVGAAEQRDRRRA